MFNFLLIVLTFFCAIVANSRRYRKAFRTFSWQDSFFAEFPETEKRLSNY